MKKIATLLLLLIFLSASAYAQRILLDEDFDSGPYTSDSIPIGWAKFKVNGPGQCTSPPIPDWRVRDSGKAFCATNTLPGFLTKSHTLTKSVSIPWTATLGSITDDWLFTDSLRLTTGDSLKFWIQLGTWPDGQSTYYLDSLQIWVTTVKSPTGGTRTRIGTVTSLPSASNTWQYKIFELSAFSGQLVYVGFRYYMNVSVNGIMVNLDDVFVGNLSGPPVGTPSVSGNVPAVYDLRQNYPNPFNPVTSIEFDLPRNEFVKLAVYNSIGQEVSVLVNGNMKAGSHKINFNAENRPSGIYIYKITAGDFTMTRKMSLVK